MILQIHAQFAPQCNYLVIFYKNIFSPFIFQLALDYNWQLYEFKSTHNSLLNYILLFWSSFAELQRLRQIPMSLPKLFAPLLLSLLLLFKLTHDFHPSLLRCTSQGWSGSPKKEGLVHIS